MDLPRLVIGRDVKTKMRVYIESRNLNSLVIGKMGGGKSVTIANWWQTDHLYGFAKTLIDPSGFLSKDAYSISGGIYCSLEHPISVNPLRVPYNESQISDLCADCINQVIKITTADSVKAMTPNMRGILDGAVKYCIRTNRRSLLNVRDYITNLKGDNETRSGLLARLNFILSDEKIVKIICGGDSIEWGELIKKKETFILDASGLGKDKCVFLGAIIINGIVSYFRYAHPKEYLPLSIYIDEAHLFISPALFDVLKEGRKYNISCTLATQDLVAIDEKTAKLLLNMGNIVAYRLGHREANLIAKELDIKAQDLQFIEKYHVAYLTPKAHGIAKAPPPPIFKERKPPVAAEPQRKSKKPSWFTLEPSASCPQPESP